MTDQPTYTLEQAAEARRHLIRTIAEVLSLVPQDLEDSFGKGEHLEQGDFRLFDLNDKRTTGRIAEMMVDRLLAWPEEVTIFPTPGVDMQVDPISRQGMEGTDAGWQVPTEQAYDFPGREVPPSDAVEGGA